MQNTKTPDNSTLSAGFTELMLAYNYMRSADLFIPSERQKYLICTSLRLKREGKNRLSLVFLKTALKLISFVD